MDTSHLLTPERSHSHAPKPAAPSPTRWLMLSIFCLNAMCNGLMYITEAAIEEPATRFYHISVARVLKLTDIFYLGYVPFVAPSVWLLTKPDGMRWAVGGGGLALAVGAALRLLAKDPTPASFDWMNAGTAVISLSTPLLLGCFTQIAANWFPAHERALATSIGVLMAQFGMLLAFVFPPIIVTDTGKAAVNTTDGSLSVLVDDDGSASKIATADAIRALGKQLDTFGYIQFVICAVSALLAILCFRTRPAASPAHGHTQEGASPHPEVGLLESCRLCCTNVHFWVITVVFGAATPIYWTLGQLVDETMGHKGSGWTEDQIYAIGILLQLASFPGFLLGGYLVDKTGRHTLVVNGGLGLATASVVGFAAALWKAGTITGPAPPLLYAALILLCFCCGFFFGIFQPAALELAAECTYPALESVSCSVLYLSCQFGGMAMIAICNHNTAKDGSTNKVNLIFCVILAVCTLAQMCLFRGELRRTASEEGSSHEKSGAPSGSLSIEAAMASEQQGGGASGASEQNRDRAYGTGWTPPAVRLSQSLA